MKCLSLGLGAVLLSAAAAMAAPFDCTREVVGSTEASLSYSINRFDRIADFQSGFSGPLSPECSLSATGRINTVSGSGLATFGNGDRYVVTVRGDLGSSFFDEDLSDFGQPLAAISSRPPDHRLDFRPLGGRNLDFAYPNGFSIALACLSPDIGRPGRNSCGVGNREFGPFFLFSGRGSQVDFVNSDGGGPYVVGTVPLPAGFPLALGALGLLGWVTRKRRG